MKIKLFIDVSGTEMINYRVIFGPDLVMLGPDEHFTQLSLSGGQPKRPNVVRTLDLALGPDFMTDIFTVETSDHARLSLQLCYNWLVLQLFQQFKFCSTPMVS